MGKAKIKNKPYIKNKKRGGFINGIKKAVTDEIKGLSDGIKNDMKKTFIDEKNKITNDIKGTVRSQTDSILNSAKSKLSDAIDKVNTVVDADKEKRNTVTKSILRDTRDKKNEYKEAYEGKAEEANEANKGKAEEIEKAEEDAKIANIDAKVDKVEVAEIAEEDIKEAQKSLYGKIQDNIFIIAIFIITIINIILIGINISKYFLNISLYNTSLSLKYNIYENKYNNFNIIHPLAILIIYLIISSLIFYYLYNYKDDNNTKLFGINKSSSYIILGTYLAIIIINIIIIAKYTYFSYYENQENNLNINNTIYSNTDGNFLNFMYNKGTYGDTISNIKKLLEEYVKEKDDRLLKNGDEDDNIINSRLKVLVSYKLNKDYINSKNVDLISNINNIVSKSTDLFSYLTIDKYNILQPLDPNDTIIDDILKPFMTGSNTIYNIEKNYDNIKTKIKEKYEKIQRETNSYINYIKKNTEKILCHIYIYFSIFSLILYGLLIILYLIILYNKNINKQNVNALQLIKQFLCFLFTKKDT